MSVGSAHMSCKATSLAAKDLEAEGWAREFGGSCLSAALRDYGRIGMFVLNTGHLAVGTAVLPSGCIL